MAKEWEVDVKIAIAQEGGFVEGWVAACQQKGVPYQLIDPHDTEIVDRLRGFTHFLWHWHHSVPADQFSARQIITALQLIGLKVFPNIDTCWHFDDKLGQKYLLEAVGLPLAKTFAFYSREAAIKWAKTITYPKVFKLRAGAGSKNVRLVRSFGQAKKLIRVMFRRGIPSANVGGQLSGTIKAVKKSPVDMLKKLYRIPHYINGIIQRSALPRQRGYCMFQEFVPGNTSDTRIVVVGKRAFGIRRMVRKNDFRASGSGLLDYNQNEISLDCVRLAFEAARKLNTQSLALDFVKDEDGKFWIVEISYGYSVKAYYKCPGYWDPELKWHDEEVRPERWILEDLIADEGCIP